eukprot:CAMPEP_0194783046 /NCGR_PEP_ID=MMETSP0323_2-20130528/79015_1 /TAXON_ID=2866 ORGANISM="Crypthecodinium cohnii, Strain Seligo" /NCGR_SAMPLE_ID=MMETSP0323_2 /ASSEMBLY_ACC=CAM_ASM_000346 /LENGTH=85 /DNA_ID=CAMNT_0039721901 /DNA_START=683 /DNA_END=940 /DNA_ORIENTATION=-
MARPTGEACVEGRETPGNEEEEEKEGNTTKTIHEEGYGTADNRELIWHCSLPRELPSERVILRRGWGTSAIEATTATTTCQPWGH